MKNILRNIFLLGCGYGIGIIFMIYRCGYILESHKKKVNKYFAYFKLLSQWLYLREKGYKIGDFFVKENLESVAIYGMGDIGNHLKYELEKNSIKIDYVIDEGDNVIYTKMTSYNLRDKLPYVDAIIVTPIIEFEEIRNRILSNNSGLKVISIEEIIKNFQDDK